LEDVSEKRSVEIVRQVIEVTAAARGLVQFWQLFGSGLVVVFVLKCREITWQWDSVWRWGCLC